MKNHRGFTLIELMLVIVIVGIFAAMVGLSVGGSERREKLLARERLEDDLALVRLESETQMRVLGVHWKLARNEQSGGYQVVRFDPLAKEESQRWLPDPGFRFRPLPEGVSAQVSALSALQQPATSSLGQVPDLLWLGNGEASPARIQLMQGTETLGEPLYVTENGQVSAREDGGDGL